MRGMANSAMMSGMVGQREPVVPVQAGGLPLLAFGGAALLGGANFIAVRFSNRDLDPFWGAGLRFALAGLIFTAISFGLRLRWPRGRTLYLTVVYGVLSFAGTYALLYWALGRVTAGAAAIVLAIVPLLTLLLAAAHSLESLTPRAVIGSTLALGGLAWVGFGGDDLSIPLDGFIAIVIAAVVMAESVIVGKRVSQNHPVMNNAVGMIVGSALLLGLSAVSNETWILPQHSEAIWAVAYLVTLGSVGLFLLTLTVVRSWTASATAYLFVLFPIVTMVLANWLADEPITRTGVLGGLVVIAGVWFGALRTSPSGLDSRTSVDEPANQ